jgi:hypothetical protein
MTVLVTVIMGMFQVPFPLQLLPIGTCQALLSLAVAQVHHSY